MTLHGRDDSLAKSLKKRAQQDEISRNTLIIRFIMEITSNDKIKRATVYHNLDSRDSLWTAADEGAFKTAIPPLESIGRDLWR
ncbi:MAG: hypothetical protein HGA96_07475 [Desulfobulbaceae bacterium]|nr:hypothetical protein [Desulfobulbaceae bacterium]